MVDISASAYYSRLEEATVTHEDSYVEVQLEVSPSADHRYAYNVYWPGLYELTHLYSPDGVDVLQYQDTAINDYYFNWWYNGFMIRPSQFASILGGNGRGTWRIQMRVINPDSPSLFPRDRPQISIHSSRHEIRDTTLGVGDSYEINMPSASGWHNEKLWIQIPANTTNVNVEGAFLDYENWYTRDGQNYEYSYWWGYRETLTITNVGTETLTLQVRCRPYVYKILDYEAYNGGLTFQCGPSEFDAFWSCYMFELNAPYQISPSIILTPSGEDVSELYYIQEERYTSSQTKYMFYRTTFHPYYVARALDRDNFYGTWALTSRTNAEFELSTTNPFLGETVTFDAAGSSTHLGSIASYKWDLGDGTHKEGVNINHAYTTPGTYNVTLTVTSIVGTTDSLSKIITTRKQDISIEDAILSPESLYQGDQAVITALIRNNGDAGETFDVYAYADETMIGTQTIDNLQPDDLQTLTFTWDTVEFEPYNYTIRVETAELEFDTNAADNSLDIGIGRVMEDGNPPLLTDVELHPESPEYNDEVTVSATIEDLETEVKTALLNYHDGSSWSSAFMTLEGGAYTASIPARPYGTEVRYKVVAKDLAENQGETDENAYTVADTVPPEIGSVSRQTESPMPTEEVEITVEVGEPEASSGLEAVTLMFRVEGGEWQESEMAKISANTWKASIPSQKGGATVEYCVECIDGSRNTKTSETLSYVISKLCNLEVTIRDEDGNPVAGVSVVSTSTPSGQPPLEGTTGTDGKVEFPGVKDGSYSFQGTKSGYERRTASATARLGETIGTTMTLREERAGVEGILGFPYGMIMIGIALFVVILLLVRRK